MKPTKAQYFFARPWLFNAWILALPLLCATAVVKVIGRIGWESLVALLLGLFLALLLGWPLFHVLYVNRSRKNGAPFRVGDRVRILAGQHRDCVVRVYQLWEARNQVRVDLGEAHRRDCKDVFSEFEICREPDD